ncbi:hypothetical protein [Streptomyces sp. NPDC056987]|uniref:hypothetical protein n=1 Tax=Streptomyces sp. NPDC056987 TaxID=3345988 RepID=UPI00363B118B
MLDNLALSLRHRAQIAAQPVPYVSDGFRGQPGPTDRFPREGAWVDGRPRGDAATALSGAEWPYAAVPADPPVAQSGALHGGSVRPVRVRYENADGGEPVRAVDTPLRQPAHQDRLDVMSGLEGSTDVGLVLPLGVRYAGRLELKRRDGHRPGRARGSGG